MPLSPRRRSARFPPCRSAATLVGRKALAVSPRRITSSTCLGWREPGRSSPLSVRRLRLSLSSRENAKSWNHGTIRSCGGVVLSEACISVSDHRAGRGCVYGFVNGRAIAYLNSMNLNFAHGRTLAKTRGVAAGNILAVLGGDYCVRKGHRQSPIAAGPRTPLPKPCSCRGSLQKPPPSCC